MTTGTPQLLPSVLRTIVPIVMGYLITAAAKRGISVDEGAATDIATVSVTAVYYLIVRLLEARVKPWFGWLLGYAKQPVYVTAPAVVRDAEGTTVVKDSDA